MTRLAAMDSSKLIVKFYAADGSSIKLQDVVPVFHNWIQFHSIREHLLIDVADYAHVPNGPGVVLIAHEANFYLDELDGKLGFSYSRKQPLVGSFADRLKYAARIALEACALLEENSELAGRIKFRTDRVSVKINDRLLAPNN